MYVSLVAEIYKHLAGQHDQKKHTSRVGRRVDVSKLPAKVMDIVEQYREEGAENSFSRSTGYQFGQLVHVTQNGKDLGRHVAVLYRPAKRFRFSGVYVLVGIDGDREGKIIKYTSNYSHGRKVAPLAESELFDTQSPSFEEQHQAAYSAEERQQARAYLEGQKVSSRNLLFDRLRTELKATLLKPFIDDGVKVIARKSPRDIYRFNFGTDYDPKVPFQNTDGIRGSIDIPGEENFNSSRDVQLDLEFYKANAAYTRKYADHVATGLVSLAATIKNSLGKSVSITPTAKDDATLWAYLSNGYAVPRRAIGYAADRLLNHQPTLDAVTNKLYVELVRRGRIPNLVTVRNRIWDHAQQRIDENKTLPPDENLDLQGLDVLDVMILGGASGYNGINLIKRVP